MNISQKALNLIIRNMVDMRTIHKGIDRINRMYIQRSIDLTQAQYNPENIMPSGDELALFQAGHRRFDDR